MIFHLFVLTPGRYVLLSSMFNNPTWPQTIFYWSPNAIDQIPSKDYIWRYEDPHEWYNKWYCTFNSGKYIFGKKLMKFNRPMALLPAWLNFNPSMSKVSNHIHYTAWEEITCPFPNLNGCTVQFWHWISDFIPHFTGHMITCPCWN